MSHLIKTNLVMSLFKNTISCEIQQDTVCNSKTLQAECLVLVPSSTYGTLCRSRHKTIVGPENISKKVIDII